MSRPEDFFNMAAYRQEVLRCIQLRRIEESGHELYEAFPQTEAWVSRQFDEFLAVPQRAAPAVATSHSYETAEKLLKRKTLQRIVCPVLSNESEDALEIAEIITPPLVEAVLSGKLAMPLEPELFADMAMVLSRDGGGAPCAEYRSTG